MPESGFPLVVANALIGFLALLFGFTLIRCGNAGANGFRRLLVRNIALWFVGSMFYGFFGFVVMYPALHEAGGHDFLGHWQELAGLVVPPDGSTPSLDRDYRALVVFDMLYQSWACCLALLLIGPSLPSTRFDWLALTFAAVFASVIYPVFGSWVWGQGWLDRMNFRDFAGGIIVIATALWVVVALKIARGEDSGTQVDVPRRGWLFLSGGVVILMLPIIRALLGPKLPDTLPFAAINASISILCGGLAVLFLSLAVDRKVSVRPIVIGLLAGYAASASGADSYRPVYAAVIGTLSGAVAFGIGRLLRRHRVADPLFVVSAVGPGALVGALAVGALTEQLVPQLVGIAANAVWVTVTVWIFLFVLFRPVKSKREPE